MMRSLALSGSVLKGLIWALLATSLLSATTAHSDPLDDARAAWRRGDYEFALQLLQPLSDAGDAGAQATLALMYEFGQGVARSPERAAALYEQAAPALDLEFRHNLAVKFYGGDGVPRDYLKAARWWREAAQGGLAESQYDLGLLYYLGQGVEQDDDEAFRWYESAAAQGFARAEHGMGVLHATGRGAPLDYAEAARWFALAAEHGFAKAQYNLALMMISGRGVERDEAQAEELLRRAAAAGEQDAVVKLAELRREQREAGSTSSPAPSTSEGVRTARPASVVAPPIERTSTPIAEPALAARVDEPARETPARATPPSSPGRRTVARVSEPAPPAPAQGAGGGQGPSDFSAAAAGAWVLQLASMSTQETADKFAERVRGKLEDELFVVPYRAGGAVRYAVLLGVYDDRSAAGAAAGAAKSALGSDPWPRRVGAVQALMP